MGTQIISYLLAMVVAPIVFFFLHYWGHRLMHHPMSGPLYKAHALDHHGK